MTDGPRFVEPIPNVTVVLGRDANLPCVVENLGTHKVKFIINNINTVYCAFFYYYPTHNEAYD